MVEELNMVEKEIGSTKSLMFAYNLIKYHIILLKRYLNQLTSSHYNKKYSHLKLEWTRYFHLPEFNNHKIETAQKLSKAEMTFLPIYQKC